MAKEEKSQADPNVGQNAEVEPGEVVEKVSGESGADDILKDPRVLKFAQAEGDRRYAKGQKELKAKDAEIEELKKASMNDIEKTKFELEKEKKELAEAKAQLRRVGLQDYARQKAKEAELGDMPIRFLYGESEEEIDEKVNDAKAYHSKYMLKEDFLRSTGRTVKQTGAVGDDGLFTEEQLKNIPPDYWRDPKLNDKVLRSQEAIMAGRR